MDPIITPRHWLIATVVLIVLEILPPAKHFFLLCFAIGALGAAIVSAYSRHVWAPWVAFAVISGALLPLLIPLARFLFRPAPSPSQD